MDELEQAELEVEALLLTVVEVVKGAEDDLQIARELLFGEEKCGAGGAGAFIAGDLQKLSMFATQAGHERVAQVANELTSKGTRAMTSIEKQVGLAHELGGVTGGNGLEQALKDCVGN